MPPSPEATNDPNKSINPTNQSHPEGEDLALDCRIQSMILFGVLHYLGKTMMWLWLAVTQLTSRSPTPFVLVANFLRRRSRKGPRKEPSHNSYLDYSYFSWVVLFMSCGGHIYVPPVCVRATPGLCLQMGGYPALIYPFKRSRGVFVCWSRC